MDTNKQKENSHTLKDTVIEFLHEGMVNVQQNSTEDNNTELSKTGDAQIDVDKKHIIKPPSETGNKKDTEL